MEPRIPASELILQTRALKAAMLVKLREAVRDSGVSQQEIAERIGFRDNLRVRICLDGHFDLSLMCDIAIAVGHRFVVNLIPVERSDP